MSFVCSDFNDSPSRFLMLQGPLQATGTPIESSSGVKWQMLFMVLNSIQKRSHFSTTTLKNCRLRKMKNKQQLKGQIFETNPCNSIGTGMISL